MNLDKYFAYIHALLTTLFLAVLFIGSAEVFVMAYVFVFIIAVARTMVTPSRKRIKWYLLLTYSTIFAMQLVVLNRSFYGHEYRDFVEMLLPRAIGTIALLLPMIVNRYVITGKYAQFYLPSASEAATIGISEVKAAAEEIKRRAGVLGEAKKKLRYKNIREIIEDMRRHSSFNYVNNDSLTEEYFAKARESLSDHKVYIIISKTGSPQSEIISIFTRKPYNHVSLSFDRELKTTISYNGGQKVYPPGLNMEMLDFFSKSPDSKLLVYSLPCTHEQKKKMLDKIAQINREGSAYNMLGLMLKRSYKPNIMFCSQFVYKMLDFAGLSYFEMRDGKVSPTDMVELDYYRKLTFEQEINLG